MMLIAKKNLIKIVFLAILAICMFGPKLGVEASELQDTYPLPAPIIAAFPDEDIAEWVAFATGKESVEDTITQADLDSVTTLIMEGKPLTGEQLNIFNNEVFPNVTLLTIEGGHINELPVFTAFPNIEEMNLSADRVTLFPDADYPKLKSVDLSLNNFSKTLPTFVGMDGLENINLYGCHITNIPFDAWSNLDYVGAEYGIINLGGNHLTNVPNHITFNVEWGYPVYALDETYTYNPITIKQGDAYSLYLPIVNQYTNLGGISLLGEFTIDGKSQVAAVLSPEDYYIPVPTEDLAVGTHEISLYIQDYYGSHITGEYSISVTVE
ncbi:hypothetical protein LMxysn_0843 [Listeria monocytogenes]|uniref:internalin N-terminal domain-containing protein n=1 Tax=Listeria monocytogenes TaxID=1639 RepID=UPI000A1D3DDF|nr:internalin [Listeria monocytogenes]ARM72478.1 hypothetical protein LMxysn_0843 [Listeria monocytogenes]